MCARSSSNGKVVQVLPLGTSPDKSILVYYKWTPTLAVNHLRGGRRMFWLMKWRQAALYKHTKLSWCHTWPGHFDTMSLCWATLGDCYQCLWLINMLINVTGQDELQLNVSLKKFKYGIVYYTFESFLQRVLVGFKMLYKCSLLLQSSMLYSAVFSNKWSFVHLPTNSRVVQQVTVWRLRWVQPLFDCFCFVCFTDNFPLS